MAKFTARTMTAPIAAFTMVSVPPNPTPHLHIRGRDPCIKRCILTVSSQACIVFVYTRSSIHSAKKSVSDRRRQDGGAVDLRREGLRQRGIDVTQVKGGASLEEERVRDAIHARRT